MADRIYYYTVEGTTDFPVDMLRYDAAWPTQECGNTTCYNILTPEPLEKKLEPRQVSLASRKKPTDARWNSFSWRVLDLRWS